eukprot:TRINITY_DN8409_c0_g1_i4.p1 TRINITY_DN8409_c0_g1~~TRINITY_DN8409_c0_g1_i4.p1  ORF type:complete len:409 (+),score=100.36 TRINITY_DN8409_c0_g1_i4:119-1228(+)
MTQQRARLQSPPLPQQQQLLYQQQKARLGPSPSPSPSASPGTVRQAPNPLLAPALLGKPPTDPNAHKEQTLEFIAMWQDASHTRTAFEQDVQRLIETHYPTEQKSFLDEVLASFMMFHPEHTTTVMAPLVSMMLSGALQYSKKRPPFHALLNLFTALDLGEDADEDELPLDQHSVNVCTDMVFYLSELCTRFNDPPPVAAWLADCLSIEGNYAFTLNYFRWLLKSSTGEHGKDAKAAVLPLPPDHLRALMKSQQRQYGNRNIELAITVVVTQCEQAAPHLQMYGDAIVATFRSTQAAAVTHTHEIFATLLSSPSSKCLLSLFEMLVAALPPPSTWMSLHLLPPLLRALGSGNATVCRLRSSFSRSRDFI